MAEKLKASRFNHFVEQENGNYLAFNALSCGLGELDKEKYQQYLRLAEGNGDSEKPQCQELLKDLKKGGFLIPDDIDELDAIRAGHYRARFGNNGFGLTIIPTVNCNFACDYCYEAKEIHSLPREQGSFMSDEVCNNIVKLCEERIPEKSAFTVTWYGGEPLLARDIIGKLTKEFIRICEAKQSKFYAGIITNGYLLTKENLNFLIDSKVTFAQVTIDGPEEVHDKRRCLKSGGPTYQRIMANLANIEEGSLFRVSIRVNIDKRNSGAILPLLEDFKARGFHQHKNISVYFGQVIHYSNSCPDIASQCMVTQEFSEFMVEAYMLGLDLGFRVTMHPTINIGSCGAVSANSAVIEPNGNIQTCWNAVGEDNLKSGILTQNGIQYGGNYMKWLGWTPFVSECENCPVLPLCLGGCPFKSLYGIEINRVGSNTCAWWKYNLKPMLHVYKMASERNLLVAARSDNREGGEL